MEAKPPHVRKASLTLIASILVLTALTGSAVLAAVTDQGVVGAELIGTRAPDARREP
jgi:hypothetical protein